MEEIKFEFIKQSLYRLHLLFVPDEQARGAIIHIFRRLKLSPSSGTEEAKLWKVDPENMRIQLPKHFEQLMVDIALVNPTEDVKCKLNTIRPRVDAIMMQLLAIAVKRYFDSAPTEICSAPYWQYDVTIAGLADQIVKTSVDYILWYGVREDWDTNLVVIRENDILEGWEILPAMCICQDSRKLKGYRGGIYGICTDSYTWVFLHLSDHGHVSKRRLLWGDSQQKIVGQMCEIIQQAFALHSKLEKDPSTRKRMVDETFGHLDDEGLDDEDLYDEGTLNNSDDYGDDGSDGGISHRGW
ncbi:hypothetical protein BDV59DRAFT_203338 [Aspergillus ambiguus]|uniref:uncharacterized protein n=1 Tax=Aspergillus ambiguus TaxID=176160 RepID=UPI003CCCD2C1